MEHHEELHDDDIPVGRLLSRREAMTILGGIGAALFAGTGFTRLAMAQTATPTIAATSIPTCVVKPALTEGPYFVDNVLNRSDIRLLTDGSLKEGALLKLKFRVSDVSDNTCSPLPGAQVDIWHCDAEGVYSGVNDPGFSTTDEIWLRGYQVTDASGVADFITVYPGWYSGRAVHIHFKIRTDPESDAGYEFTSQLFFDETLMEDVYSKEPYASNGLPDTPNDSDGIYQGSEGLLTLAIAEDEEGYVATFDIGLDLSQPAEQVGGNGGPGGNGGGAPPGGGRPGNGGTPPGRP